MSGITLDLDSFFTEAHGEGWHAIGGSWYRHPAGYETQIVVDPHAQKCGFTRHVEPRGGDVVCGLPPGHDGLHLGVSARVDGRNGGAVVIRSLRTARS